MKKVIKTQKFKRYFTKAVREKTTENVTGNNKFESGHKLVRHSSLGKYLEEMMVERREEEVHDTSWDF